MRFALAVLATAAIIGGTASAAPAAAPAGQPAAPAAAKGKAPPPDTEATGVNLARMTLGYTYFNRPGADVKTHDRDIGECSVEAAKTRAMDEETNYAASGGLFGALLGSAMGSAYHHGVVGAGLENCMVVRGWRVVHLPDAEGQALAAQTREQVAAQLAPWIGAETPHGEVVRAWNNDVTHASVNRYAMRPGHTNDGDLSLKAATGQTLKDFHGQAPDVHPVKLDKRWPRRPLKLDQLATAPADAALVIMQLKGVGLHNGTSIIFSREGPNLATPASMTDNAPDAIIIGVGTLFAKKEGNWFILAVPAGRWRIADLSGMSMMNLCLGSPAFDVKAGDVVYGGAFDLGSETLGPDLALDPAKAYLAGTPAADKVRVASYTNGSTGVCGGSQIYALEIPGAPFEPGYAFGGAMAQAATAAKAAPAGGS